MRWLKRDRRKAGTAIVGVLLLLMLMLWVPMSTTRAYDIASGLAGPVTVTVQATPTEDVTVTALNKEKLAQEIQQLKSQNEPTLFDWLRTNASILLVIGGGLIGLWRWLVDRRDAQDKELNDRQNEREKRAEERFQKVVEGFGGDKEEAKVGAAIMLRTFLGPDYKQFYRQAFDLAVANLRLPRTPPPPENLDAPLLLTTLRQALIVMFKDAFPLVRDNSSGDNENKGAIQSLDATGVQLESSYLVRADFKQAWMPRVKYGKKFSKNPV